MRRRETACQSLHGAEDLLELVRRGDLELVIAAVFGPLVQAPAFEDRGMSEAIALHVVVLHLAHTFDADRLPRQILSCAPAALAAWHSRSLAELGPFAPGMPLERIRAKRRELLGELATTSHRERGCDADVMQPPAVVVETEQQRANKLVLPVLVPAESGDNTVRGTRVLDLDHRALAWLVGARQRLGDHAVEPRTFEARQPLRGHVAIARHRCEMDRRLRAGQQLLESHAALAL